MKGWRGTRSTLATTDNTDFTPLGWLALICTKNIYESKNRSFVNSKPKPCYCVYALVEVHRKATGRCPVALDLTPYYTRETEGTEPMFIFWSLFRPSFKGKLMRAAKQKTKQGKGTWELRKQRRSPGEGSGESKKERQKRRMLHWLWQGVTLLPQFSDF